MFQSSVHIFLFSIIPLLAMEIMYFMCHKNIILRILCFITIIIIILLYLIMTEHVLLAFCLTHYSILLQIYACYFHTLWLFYIR